MFPTKTSFYVTIIAAILFVSFMLWQLFAYRAPQPSYQLVKKDGNIEIRDYPALLTAEVTVKNERYAAIQSGFRKLAGFIFGDNSRREQISMTAPVLQQAGTRQSLNQNGNWIIRFIMPENTNLKNLPQPGNAEVKFIEIPAKRYAVIRFRGFNTDSNLEEHTKQLLDYCQENHLKTLGSPFFAFYNPPWILPFLRRNEILIEIKDEI